MSIQTTHTSLYPNLREEEPSLLQASKGQNASTEKTWSVSSENSSRFREFFTPKDPAVKEKNVKNFTGFLDNVFMQLDSKKFFALMENILKDQSLTDEQIYQKLQGRIGEAKHSTFHSGITNCFSARLRSLRTFKKDISFQVKTLMGKDKKINGYVEIGYPGRMVRPLKKHIKIDGKIYVVNDKESLADLLQSGFPRPYHKFVPLNNFDLSKGTTISDSSVDMVSCLIGLHHISEDQLDPFVESLRRILRTGGSFILMDHDAKNDDLVKLAHIIHSTFNAATGVPFKGERFWDEKTEIRRFNSLDHWEAVLKKHGFERTGGQAMVREGDTTLNTTMRYIKKPRTEKEHEEDIVNSSPSYKRKRAQHQTYLTAVEWHNVRQAQGYGKFITNNHFYHFPYFKELKSSLHVFKQSWKAARQTSSFRQVAFSEYNLMNLFITTTAIAENFMKGLLSMPIALFAKKGQPTNDLEKYYSDVFVRYGEFLKSTPSYDFPFLTEVKKTWQKVGESWNKPGQSRLKSLLMAFAMTFEFFSRWLVMKPIAMAYHTDAVKDPLTIHMTVKVPAGDYNLVLSAVNKDIKVIGEPQGGLLHLEVPRYMPFTQIVKEFARQGISPLNIAGFKKMQIDVWQKRDKANPVLNDAQAKVLYEAGDPSSPEHKYLAIEVDVESLNEVVNDLAKSGHEIEYVHDF